MINHKIASISISVFYQSMTKNKELKTAYAVSFLHKNVYLMIYRSLMNIIPLYDIIIYFHQ